MTLKPTKTNVMPTIQVIQHVPFEGPGVIADWALQRRYPLTISRLYAGDALPSIGSIDWLVVMGGPMSVNDEAAYAWLAPERALICQAIAAGKTVVGVCLGAQLIAAALGARVYPNAQQEIGWFPVSKTPEALTHPLLGGVPDSFVPLHWHGDTFDMPQGATRLFQTEACINQAFVYAERVMGLQFHLEATAQTLEAMLANCRADLVDAPGIQTEAELLVGLSLAPAANGYLALLLDQLARLPQPR
jgi:GMP synthase-like glutamine amidotransferase